MLCFGSLWLAGVQFGWVSKRHWLEIRGQKGECWVDSSLFALCLGAVSLSCIHPWPQPQEDSSSVWAVVTQGCWSLLHCYWSLGSPSLVNPASFSISTLWKVKVKSLSHVRLLATPWTVAYKAPLSMGFFRQEYWSGLPFPSPGDLPNPGIDPGSPALQADALPSEPSGKAAR